MAEITFEEAVKRLEEIVRRLESGEAQLDESMKLFEEGVSLTNFCSQKINEAEKRVDILVKGENGEMAEKPFVQNED